MCHESDYVNIYLLYFRLNVVYESIPSDYLSETQERRQEMIGKQSNHVLIGNKFFIYIPENVSIFP